MSIYFFPRTPNKPLVSILIPTRGRPDHLRAAVDSVHSLASDKSCIEYLFRVDDDDFETIKVVEWLETLLPCKKVVAPRGSGYFQMHTMVQDIAKLAEGDWLFLFNDDALFKTQDWDKILLVMGMRNPWIGIGDVCMIVAPTIGRPHAQEFFFLRRRTFEILGHIALSPHNDNWIYSIMKFIGCCIDVSPIQIEHNSHLIGDKVREESVEAYKSTIESIISIQAKQAKSYDVQRLLFHLEMLERSISWRDMPTQDGLWCWKPATGLMELRFVEQDASIWSITGEVSGKQNREKVTDNRVGKWIPLEVCVGGK